MERLSASADRQNKAWALANDGNFSEALRIYRELYQKTQNIFFLSPIGLMALALEDLDAALEAFTSAFNNREMEVQDYYINLGLALWYRREEANAITKWREGLNCQYADAAGGIEIPLLILAAGIRRYNSELQSEAEAMIHKKLKSPWSKNWPAHLARFMTNEISREEVESVISRFDPVSQERSRPLLEFYHALSDFRAGSTAQCQARLLEFTSSAFRRLSSEWYFARHEVKFAIEN